MSLNKISLSLSVVLACALLSSGAGAAQQSQADDQQPLRLNATLVEVPAVVTDRAGKFVTDLTRNDFTVFEDGKRQEVSLFASIKQPFHAALVLDTSNSAQDRLRAIQSVAVGFTRQVRPDDRMMVISFDNEVKRLTDFTSETAELDSAIKATESGFGKLLYEAIQKALEELKAVEGRRAVILLSDGVDMRSIEASAEGVIRMAEEIGAVIYVVKFDTRWWAEAEARRQQAEHPKSKVPFDIDGRIPLPPDFGGPDPGGSPEIPRPRAPKIEIGPRTGPPVTYDDGMGRRPRVQAEPADELTANLNKLYGEADSFLQTVSSRTGGQVFQAETFESTRSAFASIADELRNQYLIGYYPAANKRDGKYHKIKVEVTRKELKIRTRPGYRAKE